MADFQTSFANKPAGFDWFDLVQILRGVVMANREALRGKLFVGLNGQDKGKWGEINVDSPNLGVALSVSDTGIDTFSLMFDPLDGTSPERFVLMRDGGSLHCATVKSLGFSELIAAWFICVQHEGYKFSVDLIDFKGDAEGVVDWVRQIDPVTARPSWLSSSHPRIERPALMDFRP